MDNKEFGRGLERRTLDFGVRIIRLSARLPNTTEGKVIRNQLTKAGTSVGANYREANRARSKADFRNRIAICESEASETQYWLEVIKELGRLPWNDLRADYEECAECSPYLPPLEGPNNLRFGNWKSDFFGF